MTVPRSKRAGEGGGLSATIVLSVTVHRLKIYKGVCRVTVPGKISNLGPLGSVGFYCPEKKKKKTQQKVPHGFPARAGRLLPATSARRARCPQSRSEFWSSLNFTLQIISQSCFARTLAKNTLLAQASSVQRFLDRKAFGGTEGGSGLVPRRGQMPPGSPSALGRGGFWAGGRCAR